jgi:hypothetical protein
MLNVQPYKRTPTTNVRPKLLQKEQIVAFILVVMLTIGVLLEVQQLNRTKFGFIMITKFFMSKTLKRNMQLTCQSCLQYGLCKKGSISFKTKWWHWKKPISLVLSKKLRCPLNCFSWGCICSCQLTFGCRCVANL